MNRTWKKLLALTLALILCVSLLPAAYAVNDGEEEEQGQIELVHEQETAEEEESLGRLEPAEETEETVEEPENYGVWTAALTDSGDTIMAPAWDTTKTSASGTLDNLSWTLEDGTLTISGTGVMAGYSFPWEDYASEVTKVVIKSGVTSVGNGAFQGFDELTSVSLPTGLTSIEFGAFQSCDSLSEISIPASVSYIGPWAFNCCFSLADLPINSNNQYYKCVNGVVFSKDGTVLDFYLQGKTDSSYAVPAGVKELGEAAFVNCHSLSTVTLPSSLLTIRESAFSSSGIRTLTIPASVTNIEYGAISGAYSLTGIQTASNSTAYKSVDGVLLTKDGKTLHTYPAGKQLQTYTIPDGVETIVRKSFRDAELNTIVFPESLKSLEANAFMWSEVKEFTFQGSAPSFDSYCFYGITATAYYPVKDPTWTESVRQNYGGTITWEPFGMAAPTITAQPANVAVLAGDQAAFKVKASGEELRYQWYYQKPGSSAWTAVSAASGKKATYSLTAAERHDGYKYRCVVSNDAGSVTSKTVTLTIMVAPTITTQPKSQTVMCGNTASFKVVATGGGLKYQWYYRTSKTDSWTAVSAASGKTANYSLTTADRHNGYQYRCKVSNDAGALYSSIVTLTVTPKITAPVITTQPKSVTVAVGKTAKFTISASGQDLSYQWYYRTSTSGSWTAVAAASGKTATYSLTAAERHNGYQYRCKVTNSAGTATSSIVTLTVSGAAPTIITQPKSVSVKQGSTASFTVKAVGSNLSYQWYYRTSSTASWTAVAAASGKTATYSLTTAARHNGYQYRCKVTNSAGSVTSSIVKLTVTSPTTYRALLVGQNYTNVSSVSTLYGDLDLQLMQQLLSSVNGAQGGTFAVTSLTDASAADIQNGISKAFAGATESDVSVFYYSGHGVVTHSADYYAGALVTVENGTGHDTLPLTTLAGWLKNVPGKVVVLLDSCGSGAAIYQNGVLMNGDALANEAERFAASAVEIFAQMDEPVGDTREKLGDFCASKYYVLTAASYDDTSLATNRGSLFTLHLMNGSIGTMPADTSGDSKVSVHELYTYIEKNVNGQQATQEYPVNSGYTLFAKK